MNMLAKTWTYNDLGAPILININASQHRNKGFDKSEEKVLR